MEKGMVVVRKAVREDLDSVADMIARLKIFNEELNPVFKTIDNVRQKAEEYFLSSLGREEVILLVADIGGEIAGFIRVELVERTFYEPRLKALITDIYVRPRFRRGFVGHLLVEAASKEARMRGAGMLSAVYPATNYVADQFYKNLGFKQLQVEVYKEL